MADEKNDDPNKNVDLSNGDAENKTGNPPPSAGKQEDGKGKDEKKVVPDDAGEGNDPDPKDPPKEEGKEDEDKPKEEDNDKELDTATWGDTGDNVGNSVLQIMQNSGVTPEDAKALLYDAVEAGEPNKIDRDALVEKVGKVKANLIMAGVENFVERTQKAQSATLGTVYEIAGGKDQWGKIAPWIKENVPESERQEYAAMLDKGGAQARFAAQELVNKYNADPKNTSVGKKTTIEGDGKAGDKGEVLTRTQYAEALELAHRKGASQAEITKIQRARERGRKQGI
tara:strand:+ start:15253 stop:16104 length:852 start_codon:yes stop_codon:yes gene_type:complete